MKLRLQEVDFADGNDLALVQTRAQADDKLIKSLHPGLSFDDALTATKERWPSIYGFGPWHYKKAVDVDTGKAVGLSRWIIDEKYRALVPGITGVPEGIEIPPRKKPASLNLELAGQLGQQSTDIYERYLKDRSALVLELMATLPEYREHGVTSLMWDWATTFADEHGLMCYSESFPEDVSLLSEYGFEKIATINLSTDDETLKLEAVKREPKPKATS